MQAWKKTASDIRERSWYADTLGLDFQSLRLPSFLKEIQARLRYPDQWEPRPLRFVPAPKSQRWGFKKGQWVPEETKIQRKIRPLAHVDLEDQVVATAILLCLADRVETMLGDPRLKVTQGNRSKVIAYGHRLYCDKDQVKGTGLRHRWGSSSLYGKYFQDYQKFLKRPEIVVDELKQSEDESLEIVVVQSDLSKFYDRVRPEMLHEKLRVFQGSSDEISFFDLAERVLNWRWHSSDQHRAKRYAEMADEKEITGFEEVALPQGLVASGFFANIALIDFDKALKKKLGGFIGPDELTIQDVCYYVDDLRLVLTFPRSSNAFVDIKSIKNVVVEALTELLSSTTRGLEVSEEKTEVTIEDREKRLLMKQSAEATRIQSQISGGFDTVHGTELIGAIESFFYRQQRFSNAERITDGGLLVGVPDMKDDTAARFAAGRMRRTFRSLRPLLPEESFPEPMEDHETGESEPLPNLVLTKSQLDVRGKAFSALLIEEWIKNPGQVRLLRIALDFYPEHAFLDRVLQLLRPAWDSPSNQEAKREIKLYCLSELFRVGATETGMVPEEESDCLPNGVSVEKYRERLDQEATELISAYILTPRSVTRFPWYLLQQVFLYLAARNQIPESLLTAHSRKGGDLLTHYRAFLRFLHGHPPSDIQRRSIFLVESITAFGIRESKILEAKPRISQKFLMSLYSISPQVTKEVWRVYGSKSGSKIRQLAIRLGLVGSTEVSKQTTPNFKTDSDTKQKLSDITPETVNPFYEEENLLRLAKFLLSQKSSVFEKAVSPSCILYSPVHPKPQGYEFGQVDPLEIDETNSYAGALFNAPDWCENNEDRQRFNVGLLLRYALRGSIDFLSGFRKPTGEHGLRYTRPISHWEQQRYSGYQGRDAFGPSWLPISSFTENLLFELLRWPGAGIGSDTVPIQTLREQVESQLNYIVNKRGQYTLTTYLKQTAPLLDLTSPDQDDRPLRIGVVQSVIPNMEDYLQYKLDPELGGDEIRSRCRSHLAAIMGGVEQMLHVRESHRCVNARRSIDLLVFPELAVHPGDIDTFILPFVRKYRCLVLMGQVYHYRDFTPDSPLINSALWLVPERNRARGLQIKRIEQGKANLTDDELKLYPQLKSFRPAQWLIEYQWQNDENIVRPLRLTASVCYDATDIALTAELRSRSDLYIICALNKDVGTFDRMTEALHYNMFQGVILVNNGQYGGSSLYVPFKKPYEREVLHLHGQPQASIAFAELSPRKLVYSPNMAEQDDLPPGEWKTPPAGWKPQKI